MLKILKKLIFTFFCIIFLSTLIQAQNDAIVVGQIDSATARSVRMEFKRNHFLLEDGSFESVLDANNTFSFRVKLTESRAIYFTHRNESVRLFLTPGDTLKMHFKSRHMLETMVLDGSAALHNDYMIKSESQSSELNMTQQARNSVKNATSRNHLAFIDSIYNEKKRFFDGYSTELKSNFSNDFLDFALNDVTYWRAYYLMEYVRENGLTNTNYEKQVDDLYFSFLFETDNAYYKALNNQNYVQYLELYLGYLREKSGRGKQSDGDTLEIHTSAIQKVRSTGANIRILEEPYLKNDIVSWLSPNEEAEYQSLSTSEKFKYILPDTTIEDIFLRVKTSEGRYGWVPQSMVNVYQRLKTDTIRRRRFCYQPEKEFCGFEENLTGKVLYFTMTKDILMGFMYDDEASMRKRMTDFIARNTTYEEYNIVLRAAFKQTLTERARGERNRVFIPVSCEIEKYDKDRSFYAMELNRLPLAKRVVNNNVASLAFAPSKIDDSSKLAEIEKQKAADLEKARLAEIEAKKAAELEKARLSEIEAKKAAELEKARLAEIEAKKAAELEKVRLAEIEAKKAAELEKARLTEIEAKKAAELEKVRVAEIEAKKAADLEKTRLAEIEKQKAIEKEKIRLTEIEAKKAAELEKARLAEIEKKKAADLEKARLAEIEKQKAIEKEKIRLAEIEAKKAAELEKARLAEIEKQKAIEKEKIRLAEIEAKKAAELERARLAEIEKQKAIEKEKIRLAEIEKQKAIEKEKIRLAEIEVKKAAELEKARLAEIEKQKAIEKEKIRLAEIEAKKAAELEKTRLAAIEKQKAIEKEKNRLAEIERTKLSDAEKAKLVEVERVKLAEEKAKFEIEKAKLAEEKAEIEKTKLAEEKAKSDIEKAKKLAENTPPKSVSEQNYVPNAPGVKNPNEIINDPNDKNPKNPNDIQGNGVKMVRQPDGSFKAVATVPTQSSEPVKSAAPSDYVVKVNNDPTVKTVRFVAPKGLELDTTQEIIPLMDKLEFDPTGQFVEFKGLVLNDEMPRFTLTDLNGKTVTQEEIKNKVVFIDFWASWCGPCVAQFSHAKILMEKYKNDDVIFLYISIDTDEASWKDHLKYNPMAGMHGNDKTILPINFQVTGIPNSFIIAKSGKVAFNSRLKSKINDDRMIQLLLNSK